MSGRQVPEILYALYVKDKSGSKQTLMFEPSDDILEQQRPVKQSLVLLHWLKNWSPEEFELVWLFYWAKHWIEYPGPRELNNTKLNVGSRQVLID